MVNKLHLEVLQSRPINYTSGAKNILHELQGSTKYENCGTWERSSASDRASECASTCASESSTQSQQFARHFCECNVNCKIKYDLTNEARNNCNTSFPRDFDWAIHF